MISERVYCNDYTTTIHLQEIEAGLELTADVGDQDTTVVLDATAVRKLQLILTRYEKEHR